ncbi:Peptidyl-Prolyl Cis-Trans Isomerase A-Like 4C [Manis pentadactyla]|nr:Peptidyl-Prolyl Cis-Trans Isomerase A-Like 4C [Manis pentadactyla]
MGHVIRERLPAWLLAVARLCGRRTVLGGVSPLLKRVRKDLAAAHPFLPPGSYLRPWATGRKPVQGQMLEDTSLHRTAIWETAPHESPSCSPRSEVLAQMGSSKGFSKRNPRSQS